MSEQGGIVVREGGCACGAVRFAVEGEPVRVGLCHCTSCRKESGSAFTAYAIWPRQAFSGSGEIATWEGRSFCPICGSRLYSLTEDEAEVKIGALDEAPTTLSPQYELWVWRREHWLDPLPGRVQHQRDRE